MNYDLRFEVAVEEGTFAPAHLTFAQGIWEGLPKEWFDPDVDGYSVTSITPLVTIADAVGIENTKLKLKEAEVGVLQDRIANLMEKNDSQSSIIQSQLARIKALESKAPGTLVRSEEVQAMLDGIYTMIEENGWLTTPTDTIDEIIGNADVARDYMQSVIHDAKRLRGDST